MSTGKPGISSYDKFALGHAIRTDLKTLGGNLLGLNSTIMKLSNGDDDSRARLDWTIGSREVRRVMPKQIGRTVSSTTGGVGPRSTPARTANLLGNPYMRRYEGPAANGRYNFGLDGAPAIGEYYDVYESENNHVRFLDDTIGRDLFGYTHLENAAEERSGEAVNDKLYLRSTYSVFGDIDFPFDPQDVENFKLGPKRYSPSNPYVLKPLESGVVRRTMDGSVQGFKENFEAFIPGREPYTGPLLDYWDYMGSHYYLNILNGVAEHGLYVENYEFEPKNRVAVYERDSMPQSDYAYFLDVDTISPSKEIKGLLGKTNRLFYEGKIRSMANRFATLTLHDEGRPDFLNTATDHMYGLSRGRNLRKLDLTYENGYPNPYCRVWTTHYQYSKYKHLIRDKWPGDGDNNAGIDHYTLHKEDQLMRPNKGYERLRAMTSLDTENGRPVFSPYYVNDRKKIEEDSIKRCMFSIENLAWKDIIQDATLIRKDENEKALGFTYESIENGFKTAKLFNAKGFGMTLTKEQRGPNGGRIMWFPPYNLKFNEQVHADWTPNEFIGRGEKVFSYVNSERTGTLSFTILVDHPSIINEWARGGKMGKTANKVSPLSKDEMILRYFAGCDSLEFNPRKEYDVPYCAITSTQTEIKFVERNVPTQIDTINIERTTFDATPMLDGAVTFRSVFYFPNDYSAGDFMGQKVSSANNAGTLENLLPKSQQITDYVAGLEEMFSKGKRAEGYGYELGQGTETGNSGMTYEETKGTKYYYRGIDKNGDTRSWYYPVDSRVNNEVLRNDKRYKDITDFGLNGPKETGCRSVFGTYWDSVPDEKDIVEYLNNGNNSIQDTGKVRDAKQLLGLSDVENKRFIPAYNFYKNLAEMIRVFEAATKNTYNYRIDVQGYASKHGYTKSNRTLSENRAAVIAGWIENLGIFKFGEGGNATITHNGNGDIENTDTETESDFKPKASRAAVVTLTLIPSKTIITETQEYEEIPIVVDEPEIDIETETTIKHWEEYDTSKSDDYENQTYDDEYAYFKQINENDDMVKRYISDKIDYFDPAFHSITPEGFNARLTFLQQCTRQGPTISSSDLRMGSAYGAGNLSFGRAPFCILRIGDFFNTKICIQSINIDYDTDGMHWDMNPEGIGLQPMMANVNITFTFLGGSDISGPIARLQNAASFNYYANTSVYDRRSDYRNGFVTPQDDTAKTWSPVILNKNEKANVSEHVDFYTRNSKDSDGKIKDLTKLIK